MIGCLRTRVHKHPIIVLYFEFETVLKFYTSGPVCYSDKHFVYSSPGKQLFISEQKEKSF